MCDHVTLETGSSGRLVMAEPELQPGLVRRVFWRTPADTLEWAALDDWRANGERARFYGFASRALPASMVSA